MTELHIDVSAYSGLISISAAVRAYLICDGWRRGGDQPPLAGGAYLGTSAFLSGVIIDLGAVAAAASLLFLAM